ncbi:MAG: patatin-like phospholipase family protein [Candidatus Competibacteraceae bacterium]|jgi:NTE family protein|nr:patatin-like phospholipase family protein [Candidatus Competibacteraceae bacterium]
MFDVTDFQNTPHQSRLGLALSGGGFRAALFHIGILAKLAELDVLKRVAFISTVSGGSIIGAYYYLKVKQLLEGQRADGLLPSKVAYIQLVQELEVEFLQAVQKNIRMLTFIDRRKNARMMREGYSPTDRLAELYTQYMYGPLYGSERLLLKELPINPVSFPDQESYATPTLVINSTALNTGHLWQFTGSFVGEEETAQYERHHSAMPLLPKLYFDSDTLNARQRIKLNTITLGQAVAASCCVPGLFEPLSLDHLYETEEGKDIVVRLVDGGVFDNQGLVSLFKANCTHIICSDASDLLKTDPAPSPQLVNVAVRANEILMSRIRGTILDELFDRPLTNTAFFHLGDPEGQRIFPVDAPAFVQALSHIRTDLDSFTDREAYSLMYYGYRLCEEKLADSASETGKWRFQTIEAWLTDNVKRQELLLHLTVGAKPFFKVFFLHRYRPFVLVLSALLPTALILGGAGLYGLSFLPAWANGMLALLVLSGLAYSQNARINIWLDRFDLIRRNRRRLALAMTPLGIPTVVGMVGAVVTHLHLHIFDRLFLRYGRLDHSNPAKPLNAE